MGCQRWLARFVPLNNLTKESLGDHLMLRLKAVDKTKANQLYGELNLGEAKMILRFEVSKSEQTIGVRV